MTKIASPNSRIGFASLPAAKGYAMPAEWEPHQCTWISWPHKEASWPGKFAPVEPVMKAFVAALSKNELVRINVLDEAHQRHVESVLEGATNARNICFHHFPTNDAWCRDHGAVFVVNSSAKEPLLALDFRFNAWGGKYPPFDLDNAIPPQMAEALGVPVKPYDIVMEGGSIDVNGRGALLTTEQCLLHPNRNPRLNKAEIEAALKASIGCEQIFWLGDGIVGDDTDGHVDDLTRFVNETTVVTMIEKDRGDENYQALAANRERLDQFRLSTGERLQVVELDMPRPVEFAGDRLPASYANFYIANKSVLVPTFEDPADAPNLAKLSRCFPGREIIGIDCTDLVLGLGTFHCLTQQVPEVRPSTN